MPINVKDATAVAAKWARRASSAGTDYKDGVLSSNNQATNAAAAAGLWASSVADAAGRGAFAKGVNAAGNEKWQRKAGNVGAQRYGPGVTAAQPDFQTAIGPVLSTIASVTLPPRGIKGSNAGRNDAVVQALMKAKRGA